MGIAKNIFFSCRELFKFNYVRTLLTSTSTYTACVVDCTHSDLKGLIVFRRQGHNMEYSPNTLFLLAGYYSWRNEQQGSHYISALCSVLDEEASSDKPRDFVSLMAVVNRQLGLHFESYTPSRYKTHRKKQTPCFVSSLTRKLVLAPRDSAA